MALQIYTEHIDEGNIELPVSVINVNHDLDTLDIFVQVWQNNYLVQPSVVRVDKNNIELHSLVGGNADVVVIANVEQKSRRKISRKVSNGKRS